jgi:hypothetical protein
MPSESVATSIVLQRNVLIIGIIPLNGIIECLSVPTSDWMKSLRIGGCFYQDGITRINESKESPVQKVLTS